MERARPDLYRVLQVDPSANQLVIQAAYRVLAQIFHPDLSGDEAEMKRLNAAWEVLGDPRRRKQYDIERAGRHPGTATQAAESTRATEQRRHHAERTSASSPGMSARSGSSQASDQATQGRATDAAAGAGVASPVRPEDHAGPPPGRPFGPVLRFGRYDGWSIGEIATVDRTYLEWLRNVPAGRGLRDGIDAVLSTRKGPGAVDQRRHYESNQQHAQVHTWRPGAPTKVG